MITPDVRRHDGAPRLTRSDLADGLRALGLAPGMAVEVHSSLSAFGHVVGGAEAVVDALMDVVGPEGALVMPAFRYSPPLPLSDAERARGITTKLRVLDPDGAGRTGMGAVADAFRRRDDVVTGPGFYRVCAWGRDVGAHSQGFQHLLDIDGWALLLGVDIHRLSTMHYAEHRVGGLPPEVVACFAPGDALTAEYPPAEWCIEAGRTPEDGWAKIQDEVVRDGLVRQRTIGAAPCMLFRAAAVTGRYEAALRTDPYRLFGVVRRRFTWR